MSTERPKYDPVELAAAGLTEEEAEDLRQGLEEVDRGEGMSGVQFFAELREDLEALAQIEERRERARRTG
jgi:hypothetical protein